MKKLLFILPSFLLSIALNAKQTEDEVHIGSYPKGKTFGNYKGPDTKSIDGQKTITGMVTGICKRDCCNNKRTSCSVDLKSDDGIVTVGTRDYGFTVPKEIEGHTIIIEGRDAGQISGGRKRRDMKKDYQKDIQFAATGIMVID
jgi:hypothetical protein